MSDLVDFWVDLSFRGRLMVTTNRFLGLNPPLLFIVRLFLSSRGIGSSSYPHPLMTYLPLRALVAIELLPILDFRVRLVGFD